MSDLYSSELGLQKAQALVDDWIKNQGVRYFEPMTNLAILVEEVGELARLFARTYGEQSFKDSDKQKEIPGEMADVLFVVLCLANQCGVDLEQALRDSIEKKTLRDAMRHKANPKLMQQAQ